MLTLFYSYETKTKNFLTVLKKKNIFVLFLLEQLLILDQLCQAFDRYIIFRPRQNNEILLKYLPDVHV